MVGGGRILLASLGGELDFESGKYAMHTHEKSEKFIFFDQRGRDMFSGDARITKICSGLRFGEGPVYIENEDALIFSDIPNNRLLRWRASSGMELFRSPSNVANGNTVDLKGNLISCEHATRRLTRTDRHGNIEVLVDSYLGKRLNSPNDVVVNKHDGSVWFTDPPYGLSDESQSELPTSNVFRFDPVRLDLRIAVDDFDRPNGLAFSPDGTLLYIADSGASRGSKQAISFMPERARHVRVFNVDHLGKLSGGRIFAEIQSGVPDGIKVDSRGNLWSTASDGLHCYASDGALIASVLLPEIATNLTFDGAVDSRIFVTTVTSVYEIYLGKLL